MKKDLTVYAVAGDTKTLLSVAQQHKVPVAYECQNVGLRHTTTSNAAFITGLFAVFHGHAHGAEMPPSAGGLEFAAGFMTATALLHAAGIAAAVVVAKLAGKYGRIVAQVAGGAFALGGIGILAGWL